MVGGESVGVAIYLSRPKLERPTIRTIRPTIRIQLNNGTIPVGGFGWLVDNFLIADGLPAVGAQEIFRVSLTFGDHFDMEGGAFIPILDWLSAVKVGALTIKYGCNRGEELFKYMGEMKEDSRWRLPHLTSLTVWGSAGEATPFLIALQRRKHDTPLTETAAVTLEVLTIDSAFQMELEDTLAELICPNGSLRLSTASTTSQRNRLSTVRKSPTANLRAFSKVYKDVMWGLEGRREVSDQ
ncbi:hypothetical protein M407DRAFT_20321 [Tulasnella calospora MUT 4182]|uniref:Uncharacterized protein n=1 Tax=Tulasnella calospora MUT 4182 TaxID=1051891 RepID=A0A0C3QG83_9AGAM|nr:hypothetical protein M407DRAFT_20321 [Tulasnella calospora MUT 4182]